MIVQISVGDIRLAKDEEDADDAKGSWREV